MKSYLRARNVDLAAGFLWHGHAWPGLSLCTKTSPFPRLGVGKLALYQKQNRRSHFLVYLLAFGSCNAANAFQHPEHPFGLCCYEWTSCILSWFPTESSSLFAAARLLLLSFKRRTRAVFPRRKRYCVSPNLSSPACLKGLITSGNLRSFDQLAIFFGEAVVNMGFFWLLEVLRS